MGGSRDAGNRSRSWGVQCPVYPHRYVLTNFMYRYVDPTFTVVYGPEWRDGPRPADARSTDTHIIACTRRRKKETA